MSNRDFMKGFGTPRRKNINDLSRFTIGNDQWDREDVQRLLSDMPDFEAYREKLTESKAGELGYDVWQDLYLALWKVDPQDLPDNQIRPTHLINAVVMDEAEKLPDFKELRNWTMGDDIGTALACNTIEPDMETIYDRLEEEIKQAQDLQQMMREQQLLEGQEHDLDQMMKEWTEQNPEEQPGQEQIDWSEKMAQLQQAIGEGQQEIDQAVQDLKNALNGMRPGIKQSMKAAMGKAVDQQESSDALAQSWGLEPGQLHRLPANERMELAKRLNNPKFKKLAELFGPMKRLAFTEQRRKVNFAPEEIYDVELGNNLRRALPSELAKIGDPMRKLLFIKDFLGKRLMQYKMRGYEKVAKGGIVYCHDGSGSMSGENEMWAKAVGLCLLHIAKKQKRPFYAIQFGSPNQIRIDDFRDSQNITPEKVIDFAEFFFGGGTDFMTPLNHAVTILNGEFESEGRTKSDIVFATDGMCGINDKWMEEFRKAQKKIGFKVWGINIGGNPTDEPMHGICEGHVATIRSIVNGEGMRQIFGQL